MITIIQNHQPHRGRYRTYQEYNIIHIRGIAGIL